jgi:hypothetical protein
MCSAREAGLAAYCGLYCGACAVYQGKFKEAARSLQGLVQAYKVAEWAPDAAKFIPALKGYSEFEGVLGWLAAFDCQGCLAGGGDPECPIRICAKGKGLAGCWECDEEPCEKLEMVVDKDYPGCIEERRRIREIGLEAWVAEMAAKVEAGFSYLEVLAGGE